MKIVSPLNPIRILLVEDHQLIRNGIKLLLEQQKIFIPEITEAANGVEAVKAAGEQDFDVILMDIEMPVMDGIEAARSLLRKNPDAKILALTMHSEDSIVREMLKIGALGYLLKNVGIEELAKAIITVYDAKKYYSNEVAQILLNNGAKPSALKRIYEEDLEIEYTETLLSPREKQVLYLVAMGYTNPEIAKEFSVTKRTVETHKSRIMSKLNLKNTSAIIKYAYENKIIK